MSSNTVFWTFLQSVTSGKAKETMWLLPCSLITHLTQKVMDTLWVPHTAGPVSLQHCFTDQEEKPGRQTGFLPQNIVTRPET